MRPERHGVMFHLVDRDGAVLLRRRPPEGLLGGMTELPGTTWRDTPWSTAEASALAPTLPSLRPNWRTAGTVRHVFTHFALTVEVWSARVAQIPTDASSRGFLRAGDALADEALPTLMRKALRVAESAQAL